MTKVQVYLTKEQLLFICNALENYNRYAGGKIFLQLKKQMNTLYDNWDKNLLKEKENG